MAGRKTKASTAHVSSTSLTAKCCTQLLLSKLDHVRLRS